MPPRTIEESHRPRASDRTMHCHSSSGQSYRLVVSENDGRRHNSEMEPQGRTIASPSRTRRQSKTLCLEKTALKVRNYVQTVGLNAETKKDRHRAAGEIFVLTFPLIGLTGFATIRPSEICWKKMQMRHSTKSCGAFGQYVRRWKRCVLSGVRDATVSDASNCL